MNRALNNKLRIIAAINHRRALRLRLPRNKKRLPKWEHPWNVERQYTAELVALVAKAKVIAKELLPAILADIRSELLLHPRMDADDRLPFKTLSDRIAEIFGGNVGEKVARNMANGVNKFNAREFAKIVRAALNVDVFVAEPWLSNVMEANVRTNVALISSIPNKLLPEVETIIGLGYQGSVRVEDLADQIFGRFDVAESRAKLIARDQTSKLNGALTRLRQQNIGGEDYVWRTSLDERVRHSHAQHEGKRYAWAKPPENTGNPGDDYECRCYGEMVLPDDLGGALDNARTGKVTQEWMNKHGAFQ